MHLAVISGPITIRRCVCWTAWSFCIALRYGAVVLLKTKLVIIILNTVKILKGPIVPPTVFVVVKMQVCNAFALLVCAGSGLGFAVCYCG
jgi:hypothetical protein